MLASHATSTPSTGRHMFVIHPEWNRYNPIPCSPQRSFLGEQVDTIRSTAIIIYYSHLHTYCTQYLITLFFFFYSYVLWFTVHLAVYHRFVDSFAEPWTCNGWVHKSDKYFYEILSCPHRLLTAFNLFVISNTHPMSFFLAVQICTAEIITSASIHRSPHTFLRRISWTRVQNKRVSMTG